MEFILIELLEQTESLPKENTIFFVLYDLK